MKKRLSIFGVGAGLLWICASAQPGVSEGIVGTEPVFRTTQTVPTAREDTDTVMFREQRLGAPVARPLPLRKFRQGGAFLMQDPVVGITDPIEAFEESLPGAFIAFNGPGWSGGYPPDPIIDVGPGHVAVGVNNILRFYNKNTGAQTFTSTFESFFSSVGGNWTFTSDPKLFYDRHSNRWFVMILGIRNTDTYSYYLVAVSDDSDPNGVWTKWAIDSTVNGSTATNTWSDYPGFGYDQQAIYISANMFSRSTSGFQYVKLRILPKEQMLNGSSTLTWTDIPSITTASGGAAFTIQPAWHYDTTNTPFMASVSVSASSTLFLYHVNDPLGSPTLTKRALSVNSYGAPPSAPQSGTTTRLSSVDTRLMNAVWRNNRLYLTHGTSASNGGAVNGSRWYEVNTTGGAGSATLVQQGTISESLKYQFMPAIAVNNEGTIAVGFSRSASTEFASMAYVHRFAGDATGTMRAPVIMKAGTNVYTGEGGSIVRWGDYSGAAVDPSDERVFWFFNMYPSTTTTRWATWIQSVTLTSLPTVIQGAITGNPSPNGLPITVKFRTPFTLNTQHTYNGVLSGVGDYRFSPVQAGRWDINVKVSKYLSKTLRNYTLTNGETLTLNYSLLCGDVNDDDFIDDLDLLAVLLEFGGTPVSSDLNRDGEVNDLDLLIVLINFAEQGDL
ncbi:MAG: hypothetical protein KIT45_01850 [Fimbriimonadia bacterium]|nr:hypothetical protein [Fimbriimonadia bacterium]